MVALGHQVGEYLSVLAAHLLEALESHRVRRILEQHLPMGSIVVIDKLGAAAGVWLLGYGLDGAARGDVACDVVAHVLQTSEGLAH
eukprot:CAMPEP_0114429164 /NCGR_PEP_ID=MMETSP0103-20121206/9328_1 /TAXON_ID=37642 ORGANISM="Paraphysomonas imperforata, Strain PA2" /NCGR_SAMPLE_ID=MMETSP0103 /ASSEMBLY_ACC=CAM_ASM_000201 /LENGTH=85 /DNA_ID=CAMNT_0001598459 /DNA_START=726 /DNA_END=983 /DNA_ORIENTATION=-